MTAVRTKASLDPAVPTRSEKELIDASRAFVPEHKLKSWWALLSTLALVAGAVSFAAITPHDTLGWVLRGVASVIGGLLVVRTFILYHDYLHAALLRNSSVARAIFWVYGMLIMTPPKVWKETHNYHHANTAKIVGSHVGSYMMVTTAMWAKMKPNERFMYKVVRHPLTVLLAYFTLFMFGMGVSPFLRAPKKHWACGVGVLFNWTLSAFIIWKFGAATWVFAMFLPLAISMAAGGYLFYAQHNFPEIHVQPRETWNYTRAALESSSYMEMGPLMRFFCGNIGYHHVHHLNSMIPFYRLPEAMAAIPELQHPPKTSLLPGEIIACFRLKLWDADQKKMVGFPSQS